MFLLNDKVIVITGGEGLIGKAIVKRLKKAGATVISADIQIDAIVDENVYLDITKEESISNVIATTIKKFGKIDGWVNNAYPRTKDWANKLEDIPSESWRMNIDMHLNGYFLCARAALEQMKKQGFGCLVNMSSIYGVVAPDFSIYDGTKMTMPAAYAAIKGGIVNLTRYLAAYYGPYNVRVNSVSPGGIFDNQPDAFVSKYNKKVPLRRMGTPRDIASSIHFLLSDDAAYVTGHNLMVDGGWTIV